MKQENKEKWMINSKTTQVSLNSKNEKKEDGTIVKTKPTDGKPFVFECEIVKQNIRTMWVRLPDSNMIKRHKMKDYRKSK